MELLAQTWLYCGTKGRARAEVGLPTLPLPLPLKPGSQSPSIPLLSVPLNTLDIKTKVRFIFDSPSYIHKKFISHQLAKSWNKIVRVITKQPSFDLFPKLSRAGKNLALVQDKNRSSSGKNMGKITIKHASYQLSSISGKGFPSNFSYYVWSLVYFNFLYFISFIIMISVMCQSGSN